MTPYNLELHKVSQAWKDVKPSTYEQWSDWRGKKVAWQEQVTFMKQELEDRFDGKTDELVKEYAPDIFSGLAGALFHGIIHLGWAIDAESPWMICEGLAYLNFCHLGVDETEFEPDKHDEPSLIDSVIRVAKTWESRSLKESWVDVTKAAYDESFHPELVPAGFQWELSKVLKDAHPVATELPTWLKKDPKDLWEALYRDTYLLYLATRDSEGNGNFLVLHLITSLWGLEHATRVVDNTDVTRQALGQYYATLISVLATSGFPSAAALQKTKADFGTTRVDNPGLLDWQPIVQNGIAEEEEHNIKLVYVSQELWHRYGYWSGFSEAARAFTLTPDIGPRSTSFAATD